MSAHAEQPPVLWAPSQDRIEQAPLTAYSRWLEERLGRSFESYEHLWVWSVENLEAFWCSIWDYFDVQASAPYERVLGLRRMPGARWFPGARLNFAEHVFRGKDDAAIAILHAGELREGVGSMTWGELAALTARARSGLLSRGIGTGDRVVAYLPNVPEAVAGFLACASIGAIWSSCSPDFGSRSVVDRFAQIEPRALIAVDGYRYAGRDFDRRQVVDELRVGLPTLEVTVLLPHLEPGARLDSAIQWEDFLQPVTSELEFEHVESDHPLWVLYSSGTTGHPKGIVQGHGGILLEQLKHQHLQMDTVAGDRLFWFTTTGWMMWNSLISGLLTDAAIVLYDGSPAYPSLNVLWDLADEAGVTCFGTSAAYIATCMKAGLAPAQMHDLSALRSVGSTGSSLPPEGFTWVYENLDDDTWLFSTSGGTDVCAMLVGGIPTLPVYEGELQARALGVDVEAFDDDGEPLIGEVGDLVVKQPMPSMPLYLWGDIDGRRMHESYFERYPGIWRHGDWITITSRGTAIIHGRSDTTINRGGVRMGTSEIYRVVLAVPEVVDALVVDVDGWMPLFVVVDGEDDLDEELKARIVASLRAGCSPRHVPDEIIVAPSIPRTLSGKVLELPVKRILQGVPAPHVANRDGLMDRAALDWFEAFSDRKSKRCRPFAGAVDRNSARGSSRSRF